MIDTTTIANRAGYSDAPSGTERTHILTVLVEDRFGSVDRVVGVLRRKRANTRSLSLSAGENSDFVRITAQVKDSDVSVENLVEHLRKVFDVHSVTNVTEQQAAVRELALVKINTSADNQAAVTDAATHAGGVLIESSADSITFEISGDEAKLGAFFAAVEAFGVREVIRSGAIAISHGSGGK